MISGAQLSATSAVVLTVTFAVLLVWLRRIPARLHRRCYPILFVVGLGAVTELLSAAGVGLVGQGAMAIEVPRIVNDLVGYAVMWGIVAWMGDAPRRLLAVTIVLPPAWITVFQFGMTAGGLVGVVSALFVVGSLLAFLYLFWGPIWRRAKALPDDRRLLFWKARNLLYFLNVMLTVYAFLLFSGVFSLFGMALIGEYVALMIRVGFAGFLFANIDALDPERSDRRPAAGAASVEGASPVPDVAD